MAPKSPMAKGARLSPAEEAGKRALDQIFAAIRAENSFKLEAGAGAGKTYSLVEVLRYLINEKGQRLLQMNQRIACITFTNVAKDEIEARTNNSRAVYCDTIHGFCWAAISEFQHYLRIHVPELNRWSNGVWADRLKDVGEIGNRKIEYLLGRRSISDGSISLHHDDILPLIIKLFSYKKFRNIFRSRYPVILIDEYQDTDANWMRAICEHFLPLGGPPLFGFFGDHWQKIYGNGCGNVTHQLVKEINKGANFRSVPTIVNCLNRMRPELPQSVADPSAAGEIRVFLTNKWTGERKKGPHYQDDLPDDAANAALNLVRGQLAQSGWDLSPNFTKILMLTHRSLGSQQGYGSLPTIFRDNSSFAKMEHAHIEYFVRQLEPACRAFQKKHYGEMFSVLKVKKQHIFKMTDKSSWSDAMRRLIEIRETRTVGDVIRNLNESEIFGLPGAVEKLEQRLVDSHKVSDEEVPRSVTELQALHAVKYQEIMHVAEYLDGHSPFETKHGVKGAQFENVLAVIGRGWNRYNFCKMLENSRPSVSLHSTDLPAFENNRNLFYVVCSRPKRRLALVFTQRLSEDALETVCRWFEVKLEELY